MGRAAIVNISQLTTYSQTKNCISTNCNGESETWRLEPRAGPSLTFIPSLSVNISEGYLLHFYSSMLSGIVTTVNSMPFDIAKTRIQNQKTGKSIATNEMLLSIVQREGILALWKGFYPTYCKIGPQTVIILMCNEHLTNLYRSKFLS
jgi:solute carrier family 25 oxoglutarate transporter 11